MDEIIHESVMTDEVLKGLNLRDDKIYVDCTMGEGGHCLAILQSKVQCQVIGIEQDKDIAAIAEQRLSPFRERFQYVLSNFSCVKDVVNNLGYGAVDGILMDLGISSFHYEKSGRGFSFSRDEILDMRLSHTSELTANEVVNSYSHGELARVIRDFGEERFSGRIASAIVRKRELDSITSSQQLADIVAGAIPAKFHPARIHPATKTFQAIRIEVNGELRVLREGLEQAVSLLGSGGRLCIISFHSLEDRIVKNFMRENVEKCRCPELAPVCTCGRPGRLRLINKKPLMALDAEVERNPRARSAKLRIAEKI